MNIEQIESNAWIPFYIMTSIKNNEQTIVFLEFEDLVLDMIHLFDNCLPFEVMREKEFAPIKNATGVDSIDTARQLLLMNGYKL